MTRILILILLGLSCCTSEKQRRNVLDAELRSTPDNDFLKFVALLPQLKLPFMVNCERCCDHPKIDYDNKFVNKFTPAGWKIVGLIEKRSEKVVILFTYPADVIIPSVKVYDLGGRLTGGMDFMTNYCGGDFEYYGVQFFRINSDYSFSSIDTSYYLQMDTVDYHVIDTTKIEIATKEFTINSKGEVVENNAR